MLGSDPTEQSGPPRKRTHQVVTVLIATTKVDCPIWPGGPSLSDGAIARHHRRWCSSTCCRCYCHSGPGQQTEITSEVIDSRSFMFLLDAFPASLATIPTLEALGLSQCKNVTFPNAEFPLLNTLFLGSSVINGNLPKATSFPGLKVLQMISCSFSETPIFPAEYSQLPLTTLYISDVDFKVQQLPSNWSPSLQSFSCNACNLGGTIPQQLAEIPALQYLDLTTNNLSGSIPSNVFTSGFVSAYLGYNQLNGTLPETMVSPRTRLIAPFNRLTGTLPPALGNLNELVDLDLSNNQFFGTIPDSIFLNLNYDLIKLNNNSLSGCINATPAFDGLVVPCDFSNNYFCCIPSNSVCLFSSIECRVYTVPSDDCAGTPPTPTSTCQLDEGGNPVWLDNSNVTTSDIIVTDNFFVNGDLIVYGDLTVSDGVITVKGCPTINGSLTLNLTSSEVEELIAAGNYTRDLIVFDATCDETNIKFNSITINGEFECLEVTATQENTPGLVTILITTTEIDCPVVASAPLSDSAIAGIVVAAGVVVTGVITTAVLVSQKKQHRERSRGLANKLARTTPDSAPRASKIGVY